MGGEITLYKHKCYRMIKINNVYTHTNKNNMYVKALYSVKIK